ncbi:MAG: hypothetical protein N4A50_04770 [Vallitalea sp.]|nr:hypothetical protein [Vallitalea sp.]
MFLYGMIFFIINILANIIGLFAEYLLYVGFMNAVITKTYMFFTISQCLNIGAYIILIIGFIQFARKYND